MTDIRDIPEVVALDARRSMVRIPPETDIPLTPRIKRLIDTPEFRRLARISQLGLVSLVYPAAIHTRFEHSLGVYRLALLYLKQLSWDPRFAEVVGRKDAERLIVAALLHDLGHWPFCHPIEDMHLEGLPSHEQFAARYLHEGEIVRALDEDWGIHPDDILGLLTGRLEGQADRVMASILSGPIDIDKMDYLFRDSLHAGVPYGRHFDQQRLIGSLCVNQRGDGLAMTDKGKTAAELMVFARYVMFTEVYWHHAVRAATAMLQRAFYLLRDTLDLDAIFALSEPEWIERVKAESREMGASELLEGLFGRQRRLYKRVAQYSMFEQEELYRQLARQPFEWLVRCAEAFSRAASQASGETVRPHEVLFDAPPVQREVQFNVEICFPKQGSQYRPLGDVSPVVRALALEQFDDYVKRVRIFAHPRIAPLLRETSNLNELLGEAIAEVNAG